MLRRISMIFLGLVAIIVTSQAVFSFSTGYGQGVCGTADGSKRPYVSEVYPTANELPDNLLRFYVYFSKPMRRDGILTSIKLVDQTGETVVGTFIENKYDLWSPDGQRLTLLLDPGRVKTGLAAHETLGRALSPGQRYSLTINNTALDTDGCQLSNTYEKSFVAVNSDLASPDIQKWHVIKPAIGTRDALIIDLNGPHDHVSLAYRIRVKGMAGDMIRGSVVVADNEQEWIFTPQDSWQDQRYVIAINTTLEDIAGNRLTGLFDQPLEDSSFSTPSVDVQHIPFRPS